MEFIEVKEIPEVRNSKRGYPNRGKLKEDLEEFMSLNIKYAEVVQDFNSYASLHALDSSVRWGIKHYNFPIAIACREDTMYLIRTDL